MANEEKKADNFGNSTPKESDLRPKFNPGEGISAEFEDFILSFDNELRQIFLLHIKKTLDTINNNSNNELKLMKQLRDTQNKRYTEISSILKTEAEEMSALESILSEKSFSDPNINDVFKLMRSPLGESQSRKDSCSYEILHNRYFLYRISGNTLSFFDRDLLRRWDTVFRAYTNEPDYFIEQTEETEEENPTVVKALKNPSASTTSPVSAPADFAGAVEVVIDNFEGGYTNPSKYKQLQGDTQWATSGETMFGIDIDNFGTPEGKEARTAYQEFWNLIHNDIKVQQKALENKEKKPDDLWSRSTNILPGKPYAYSPIGYQAKERPEFAKKLKSLETIFMQARYERFMGSYDKEGIVQKFANLDKGILIHFIYAVWNGAGWFKYWVNESVEFIKKNELDSANPQDREKLYQNLMKSRSGEYPENMKNKLKVGQTAINNIANDGVKMAKLTANPEFRG